MPIHHALWTISDKPDELQVTALASEQELEDMIVAAPRILSEEWMLIGRQEATGFGGRIDLLAITPDGSLVLIELKRDRTPETLLHRRLTMLHGLKHLKEKILLQFTGGLGQTEILRQIF